MNPVTLKELRQLTRSRTIAGAIIGFFLLQFVVASLAVVGNTDSSGVLDSDCGEVVFGLLAALLAPILAFVVPGNIFSRLVSEHGPGRAELLFATALRPSDLVDGKIRSGLAMLALFLSGALPFLLCSYLLGGVDVLFVLSWALAVACCASVAVHLSVFLAALRLPAPTRWAAWALCAIPCVFFGSSPLPATTSSTGTNGGSSSSPERSSSPRTSSSAASPSRSSPRSRRTASAPSASLSSASGWPGSRSSS